MNVLIVGGGGREHAIAWKVAQSAKVEQVFVAPGNAGTAIEPKVSNVAIDPLDIPQLIDFSRKNEIELCIVGPEAPLAAGIVDEFTSAGVKCFGPSRLAAQLESSKSFCKDFMARHKIPTAGYKTFTDPADAKQYAQKRGAPLVIKADGLAAGKGVVIAHDMETALTAIDDMLIKHQHGKASEKIVIEDFLEGEEASFMVMCDSAGEQCIALATSQDHKARDDGDLGPNTGGMGAYSPAPIVTPSIHEQVMRTVIEPTLAGMRADSIPYSGFLYAGLMISPKGELNVLEYNVRLGDPETQVLMMRLKSDLVELVEASFGTHLAEQAVEWESRAALGVVMAAGGYPATYAKGIEITGLDAAFSTDQKVFHAGTTSENNKILTNGGRVLCVCALGDKVSHAATTAYDAVKQIHWKDVHYRTDIGAKAQRYEQQQMETANNA